MPNPPLESNPCDWITIYRERVELLLFGFGSQRLLQDNVDKCNGQIIDQVVALDYEELTHSTELNFFGSQLLLQDNVDKFYSQIIDPVVALDYEELTHSTELN